MKKKEKHHPRRVPRPSRLVDLLGVSCDPSSQPQCAVVPRRATSPLLHPCPRLCLCCCGGDGAASPQPQEPTAVQTLSGTWLTPTARRRYSCALACCASPARPGCQEEREGKNALLARSPPTLESFSGSGGARARHPRLRTHLRREGGRRERDRAPSSPTLVRGDDSQPKDFRPK